LLVLDNKKTDIVALKNIRKKKEEEKGEKRQEKSEGGMGKRAAEEGNQFRSFAKFFVVLAILFTYLSQASEQSKKAKLEHNQNPPSDNCVFADTENVGCKRECNRSDRKGYRTVTENHHLPTRFLGKPICSSCYAKLGRKKNLGQFLPLTPVKPQQELLPPQPDSPLDTSFNKNRDSVLSQPASSVTSQDILDHVKINPGISFPEPVTKEETIYSFECQGICDRFI